MNVQDILRSAQESLRGFLVSAFRPSALCVPASGFRSQATDHRASTAFTLMEMMVVVGMLGILMGVAFSGIGQARAQGRIAKANAEVRELINAWLAYESTYDNWPVSINGTSLDATEENLKELLDKNQDGMVFLNATMVKGAFRDPWGTPYQFTLVNQENKNPITAKFEATVTFPNRHRYVR